MSKLKILLLLICLLCFSCGRREMKSDEVVGKVVKIVDGDTFDVLLDGKHTVRVRMEGIDAPERGMPFCKKARRHLGSLCHGKKVRICTAKKEVSGRVLCYAYLEDGRELSREMLRAGFAWHFKKYSDDEELAALEQEARSLGKGLWLDPNPMAPWDNRKLHRKGISTKKMFSITTENE